MNHRISGLARGRRRAPADDPQRAQEAYGHRATSFLNPFLSSINQRGCYGLAADEVVGGFVLRRLSGWWEMERTLRSMRFTRTFGLLGIKNP